MGEIVQPTMYQSMVQPTAVQETLQSAMIIQESVAQPAAIVGGMAVQENLMQPDLQYAQPGMQYAQETLLPRMYQSMQPAMTQGGSAMIRGEVSIQETVAQPSAIVEGMAVQETLTQPGMQYAQAGMQYAQPCVQYVQGTVQPTMYQSMVQPRV